ncbi:MAG TPA: Asd/ArgC dimerization domain-containing protein [Bryobacteraceae bacterium]|nr:Asd/ArgC dimerization domain-containing protein [Bryobacteraceae bacterium]
MISIIGSETLLGRELRESLGEHGFSKTLQLIGVQDELSITEEAGEPAVITPLDADRLQGSELIFCAGTIESTRKAFELAGDKPTFIDLTYGLEDVPEARLRAPMVDTTEVVSRVHVVAHPAATAAALVLSNLPYPARHSIVQIFEPASERGQAGILELQNQTTSLLAFRQMEKRIFDAQLGFNMLARYGEDAPEQLQTVEQRIDRHLATLIAKGKTIPMPSLRLTQAPVFHGYSFSFWVELEQRADVTAVEKSLASSHIEVRSVEFDAPSNVGVAGQRGLIAGAIEPDRNHPRGVWIWAVADNFRLLVDNAMDVARVMLPGARS